MLPRSLIDICWSFEKPSEWWKDFPNANGSCQSPINIITGDSIQRTYPPFVFSSGYNLNQNFTMMNQGCQIIASLSEEENRKKPWMEGGGLNGTFEFVNFHLHWGEDSQRGADHEIDGKRFPAEVHFVHKNTENDELAVLAFFFCAVEQPKSEDDPWKSFVNQSIQLTKKYQTLNTSFRLTDFMPMNYHEFYRYPGSLTSPPCTEGVVWTVFPIEIPIAEDDLRLLREHLLRNTYRPVQNLNGRTIFRHCEPSKMI